MLEDERFVVVSHQLFQKLLPFFGTTVAKVGVANLQQKGKPLLEGLQLPLVDCGAGLGVAVCGCTQAIVLALFPVLVVVFSPILVVFIPAKGVPAPVQSSLQVLAYSTTLFRGFWRRARGTCARTQGTALPHRCRPKPCCVCQGMQPQA